MKNDLTCAVVADLLPSYADGLTGEETNRAVERHLEGCEDCRAALRKMRAPEPEKPSAKDEKELAFLRKVKKKHRIAAVCVALAMLLLASGVFGIFYYNRTYNTEIPVTRTDVDAVVTVKNGTAADITLTLRDPKMTDGRTTRIRFDEATGRLTFSFTMRKAVKNASRVIKASHSGNGGEIKSVYLGKTPLWDQGVEISERIGRAYAAAHPYMGDIMQNTASADALEIGKTYGPYTNEMTTSSNPYTWTLTFQNPVTDRNDAEIRLDLTRSAVLLLATIENLDEIGFRYTVPGEDGSLEERELTLTVPAADALLGGSVKEAGKTPAALQKTFDACLQRLNEFVLVVTDGTRVVVTDGEHTVVPAPQEP